MSQHLVLFNVLLVKKQHPKMQAKQMYNIFYPDKDFFFFGVCVCVCVCVWGGGGGGGVRTIFFMAYTKDLRLLLISLAQL